MLCRSSQHYLFVRKQVTVKLRHLFFFGIIGVDPLDRDRQRQASFLQGRVGPALRLVLQPVQLDRAGVDVGDGQRVAEVA